MTTDAASDRETAARWLQSQLDVSRETLDQLSRLVELLVAANEEQNLISRSTVDKIWWRHIVDSAQLLLHVNGRRLRWLDIGSGPGLPGLVIATIADHDVHMVETRKLRCGFVKEAIEVLRLPNAQIHQQRIERFDATPFSVISARAFASLSDTLTIAKRLSTENTQWVLPKGRSASEELEKLPRTWHRMFHVEQSVSSADSGIVVGQLKNDPERRRA